MLTSDAELGVEDVSHIPRPVGDAACVRILRQENSMSSCYRGKSYQRLREVRVVPVRRG
jgi:hypothetical protein